MLVELNYKKRGEKKGGGREKEKEKEKKRGKEEGGKERESTKRVSIREYQVLPSPPSSLQAVGAVEPLSHPASEPSNGAVERQRHQSCRSH
jgi:hypothetical protein